MDRPHHDKVATIIATYNGSRWIRKCLTHLFSSDYPSTVIVVDNQSTDNTLEVLRTFTDSIVLIQNSDNLGFGAANNIGIKAAIELGADYVFLLNQDVYVGSHCIGALLQAAKAFPRYGILSPVQVNSSGSELDAAFRKTLQRTLKMLPEVSFEPTEAPGPVRCPANVRFTNAASWFMPVGVVERVGFFHPVFYHYGEDNHYAARVQYFGYQIGVLTDVVVMHDREQRGMTEKDLVRALRVVPLYTLLDVRKPFPVAYLLGLNKLYRFRNKLRKKAGNRYDPLYAEQRKWFFSRIGEAIRIRRNTKQGAGV